MKRPVKGKIEIGKSNYTPLGEVKQLDDVILELDVYSNSVALDLSGQTISLYVRRSNKTTVEQLDNITKDKNKVTIKVKNSCFAVNGIVEMELRLVDTEGSMSSSTFYITVDSSLSSSESIGSATNEIVILDEAKKQEPIRQKNEESRQKNEVIRVSNEKERIEAELLRKQQEEQRETCYKEIEEAREDYDKKQHDSLSSRLNADMSNVHKRFNQASLLQYEGEYITAENSYKGSTEELKLKGRTLQNLYLPKKIIFGCSEINENRFTIDTSNIGHLKVTIKEDLDSYYYYVNAGSIKNIPLKPNTKYTAYASTDTGIASIVMMDIDSTHLSSDIACFNKDGIAVFTTLNTINKNNIVFFNCNKANKGDTIEIKDITILEGDWTNKPIPPYFEGIRSVAEEDESLVVKSCGKNLFNFKNLERGSINMVNGNDAEEDMALRTKYIPIIGTTIYTNFYVREVVDERLFEYDVNKKFIKYNYIPNTPTTIELNSSTRYIRAYWGTHVKLFPDMLKNVSLSIGNTIAPYEPYTEDKSEILLQDLRGLSDNVCDILDMESGRLSRNVGKIVLDGSEIYDRVCSDVNEHFYAYFTDKNGINRQYQKIIADKLPTSMISWGKIESQNTICTSSSTTFQIGFTFSLNKFETVNNFKTWLQANPVTVYYQLTEPVIENVEGAHQLRTQDGKTHLWTEGSLISPTISAKVPSNVQAVVSTLKVENSVLKNSVSTLNLQNKDLEEKTIQQSTKLKELDDVANVLLLGSL